MPFQQKGDSGSGDRADFRGVFTEDGAASGSRLQISHQYVYRSRLACPVLAEETSNRPFLYGETKVRVNAALAIIMSKMIANNDIFFHIVMFLCQMYRFYPEYFIRYLENHTKLGYAHSLNTNNLVLCRKLLNVNFAAGNF